jgi:lipopolysaccharide transport system permease protein
VFSCPRDRGAGAPLRSSRSCLEVALSLAPIDQLESLSPPRPPSGGRSDSWTENRPSRGWLPRLETHELWSYRELAVALALKDLKVRYKQTFFGVAWAIIQPLLGVLIFSVFFGRLAGLPSDGIPYPVFVYAGLTFWTFFSTGISAAAQSLVDDRDLVTKVYFPRVLAPAAAVLPGLVDLAVSLGIVVVFMAIYGVAPSLPLVVLPLWIVGGVLLAFASGLWLSALNVKYRDVRYALPFLVQLWFFASPVVFSSSLVEGGWRYVFALNPVMTLIDGFRWSLVDGPGPGAEGLVSLAVGLVVLGSGLVYFRRVERTFADLI